jgi:AraC-like DNA-binding protein
MRPLSQFPLFRSQDIDEAHQLVARHVKPHRIHVVDHEASLDVDFQGVALDGVALFHVFYGASVEVNPERESQSFFVQTTLAGEGRVLSARDDVRTVQNDTVVVSPSQPYHMRLGENCSRIAIEIDKERLRKCLSGIICEEVDQDIVFDLHSNAFSQSWKMTIDYIFQQLQLNPQLLQNPAIKQNYSELIINNLLAQQTHNYSAQMRREGDVMLPAHLRQAVDLIRDDIANPPSVVELAGQCNVTVRTLQRSFVRHLQMSPAEYIRNTRLDAVHRALLRSDSSEKGILTRILLDHGISDMGRFATYYRRKYGCTPSQTLS